MMATGHLPSKVTLFEKENNGVVYRIPSLLYLHKKQIFLAFAEKRASARDIDAKILVLRRGHLHKGSVKWEDTVRLETARLPGYRTMNPCPVYERERGVVYLFFNCIKEGVSEGQQIWCGKDAARLCYVLSHDDGASWSALTDLTGKAIGQQICKWGTFAVGPGHGIQTHCGRLMVPAYAYYIRQRCCLIPPWFCTEPHSFYFYSEDGGESWSVGDPITRYQAAECELAEIIIADGYRVMYCNARTGSQRRMEAVSLEPGHFEIVRLAKGLAETKGGCQGSVVSFCPPKSAAGLPPDGQPEPRSEMSWLLYTHPTGEPGRVCYKRNRTNLGVYVNPLPLQTRPWLGPWVIHHGPSGYSDLTYLDGMATFACLYEGGIASYWEQIAFCLFTVEDVMRNVF
ncbi:sialidase-3-like [Heptranchias perlo]|uniref:sialidase-3-like n=1 Tax=Heptranchias perlo TaxID=212740 RepID=UPI00355A06CE